MVSKGLILENNWNRVRCSVLYVFAFSLPLAIDLSRIFLVLLVIVGIMSNLIQKRFTLNGLKSSGPILLLPTLFLAQVSSFIFFNDNTSEGLSHLEKNLVFLLVPLAIFGFDFTKGNLERVLLFFVWGCVCACIACIIMAFVHSISFEHHSLIFDARVEKDPRIDFMRSINWGGNYFFSSTFSLFHHPTYFSIYLIFSLGIILKFYKGIVPAKLKVLVVALFTFTLLLLSSRASQLFFVGVIPYLIFSRERPMRAQALYLTFFLSLIVMIFLSPRTTELRERIFSLGNDVSPQDRSSIGVRSLVWRSAIDLIRENPVAGVGLGDLREELAKEYERRNYQYALESRFNAHNDFLECYATLGLLGLVIYMSILFFGFRVALKLRDFLFFFLMILIAFHALFESIFQRHAAIAFFSLFYSLFIVKNLSTTYDSDYRL